MSKTARLLGMLSLLAFGGCAAEVEKPVAVDVAPALVEQMAAQTVAQIGRMHSPAHTGINIMQETPDAYGAALIAELRLKGFAVCECAPAPPPPSVDPWQVGATTSVPPPAAPAPSLLKGGLDLHYIVDAPSSTDLYRVTVTLDHESITRVFAEKDGEYMPASAWIHKE